MDGNGNEKQENGEYKECEVLCLPTSEGVVRPDVITAHGPHDIVHQWYEKNTIGEAAAQSERLQQRNTNGHTTIMLLNLQTRPFKDYDRSRS